MFLAKAQGLEEGTAETLVLVKSLQSKDEQQQLDFRREFEMFGKLNHANVVRLLGLCREAEPHYMVLEYVDLVGRGTRSWGNSRVVPSELPKFPCPKLPICAQSWSYVLLRLWTVATLDSLPGCSLVQFSVPWAWCHF